jgi:hypothetical protein
LIQSLPRGKPGGFLAKNFHRTSPALIEPEHRAKAFGASGAHQTGNAQNFACP